MSLDVYLEMPGAKRPAGSGIFIRDGGAQMEISREEWDRRFPDREPVIVQQEDEGDEVFSANITHNLTAMAAEAGIYQHLWRPEEAGVTHAKQLIGPLQAGLVKLQEDPDRFKAHNPDNGWGSYEGLVQFVLDYLNACQMYPEAKVSVWR